MKRILVLLIVLLPVIVSGQTLIQKRIGPTGNGSTLVQRRMGVNYYHYNDSASALFARMTIPESANTKNLISMIYDTLQYYHIDDSLYVFYDFAVSDTANALLNFVSKANYNATLPAAKKNNPYFFKNMGFETGLQLGYVNSNFNAASVSPYINNGSIGAWIWDVSINNNGSVRYAMGANDGTSNYIATRLSDNVTNWGYTMLNSTTSQLVTLQSISKLNGFYSVSRKLDSLFMYKDLSQFKYKKTRGSAVNKNIYFAGFNGNGTNTSINHNTFSFAWIGHELTKEQNKALYNVLSYYIAHISRISTIFSNQYVDYSIYNNFNNALKVLCVNGTNRLVASNDSLYFSINGGITYPHKKAFNGAEFMDMSYISIKGYIFFSYGNKVYVSKDSLTTYSELVPNNFTLHTPVNSSYPGAYYLEFGHPKSIILPNNKELICWGNYANVWGGASPVNVYEILDGDSLKLAYQFGQNPSYRDDGTADGGATGTLLGNAGNPYIARHIHGIEFSGDSLFVYTGDILSETRWINGDYNYLTDTWTWKNIASDTLAGRFKSVGLTAIGDTLYWASDDNIKFDYGAFKCAAKDITDTTKHILFANPSTSVYNFVKNGNQYLINEYNKQLYVSSDLKNWSPSFILSGIPAGNDVNVVYGSVTNGTSNGKYYIKANSWPTIQAVETSIELSIKDQTPIIYDTVDFYILIGQSNTGNGDIATFPVDSSRYLVEQTGVYIFNKYSADPYNWNLLHPGVNTGIYSYQTNYGIDASLFYNLKGTKKIYILKYGYGGSDLASAWKPPSGSIYAPFMQYVDSAINRAKSSGKYLRLKGVLWIQGEADATVEASSLAYETNLNKLFYYMRRDLRKKYWNYYYNLDENAPLNFKKYILKCRSTGTYVANVVTAETNFCNNTDNNAFLVNGDSCDYFSPHYTNTGYLQLSWIFYNLLK